MSPMLWRQRIRPAAERVEVRRAVSDYLAVSRSPLRRTDPGWYEVAESAAWARLCAAVGLRPADR